VKPEKYIQDLEEELARKDEKLQHYEKELLHAKNVEAELTAARQKTKEQAAVIRKMECDEDKQNMKLAETLQKCRNLKLKIAVLVKDGSEREEEMKGKDRQLLLYEEQLKKSAGDLRAKNMLAKAQGVLKFLRSEVSEFYNLQSKVAMKPQEIERLGAELKTAALDLTRCKEENIKLHSKIQGLEDQLQCNREKKDKVERDKQPLSCTTQMFQQNSNLNFQAKSQHDTISDDVVLMAISLITDTGAPPANSLFTNHIKNPELSVRTTKDICTNMDWE
jgi:chromosome segregation ATPase